MLLPPCLASPPPCNIDHISTLKDREGGPQRDSVGDLVVFPKDSHSVPGSSHFTLGAMLFCQSFSYHQTIISHAKIVLLVAKPRYSILSYTNKPLGRRSLICHVPTDIISFVNFYQFYNSLQFATIRFFLHFDLLVHNNFNLHTNFLET